MKLLNSPKIRLYRYNDITMSLAKKFSKTNAYIEMDSEVFAPKFFDETTQ